MNKYREKIYSYIDSIALKADLKRRAERANGHFEKMERMPLTSFEKDSVRKMWGKYGGKELLSFGFYKSFCGRFDVRYVPSDFYDFAEHVLNLRWPAYFMQHKCNLKYFIAEENRAKNLLQKIDGHFVKEDNTEISFSEAKEILLSCPEFIAKIARGTGGGKGVRKIVWNNVMDKESLLNDLMSPIDMEYEYVLKQNDFMAQFNPDSVNTFRILSLNINGHCSILCSSIRMGSKGSVVDNVGSGGCIVGVNQNGILGDFGVNNKFDKKYESSTGVVFKGVKVPDYEEIKRRIIFFHSKIPFANLIAWDVAIDEHGEIKVIEVNLDSGIIIEYQVLHGPVFGDRLEEVMSYIESRKPLLKHQMMLY